MLKAAAPTAAAELAADPARDPTGAIGASTTGSSSYAFPPRYRTRPAGGGPLLDRQGLLPPSTAPPASGCPSASPDRYGGRGQGLSPHPVIWRLVAQCRFGRNGGAGATGRLEAVIRRR